jgi:hypothetical protein
LFITGQYQQHQWCMMSSVSTTLVRNASPLSLAPVKCIQVTVILNWSCTKLLLYRAYFIPNYFIPDLLSTKLILFRTYFLPTLLTHQAHFILIFSYRTFL